MSWWFFALTCAFFTSTQDALSKFIMRKADEYALIWLRLVFSLPILFLFMLSCPFPRLEPRFWIAVFFLLPLELVASVMYNKSLKGFDLSQVVPFLGFTPIFSIAIAFLMLKEKPSLIGFFGIILIFAGAYLLNIHTARQGLFEPIKEIARNKGTMLMLVVAVIYALTSTLGKYALLKATLYSFPFIYFFSLFFVMTPIALYRFKKGISKFEVSKKQFLYFIALGAAFSLSVITHYKAISMTEVSYMISVKRLSLLFGVVYGGMIFKEKNIRVRFTGALFMVLGAILLSFA